MPHILKEHVVSLLSLDEHKAFQDWMVLYPSIITENKTSVSLLQHQDVVPTLLEMIGLSPMQWPLDIPLLILSMAKRQAFCSTDTNEERQDANGRLLSRCEYSH